MWDPHRVTVKRGTGDLAGTRDMVISEGRKAIAPTQVYSGGKPQGEIYWGIKYVPWHLTPEYVSE